MRIYFMTCGGWTHAIFSVEVAKKILDVVVYRDGRVAFRVNGEGVKALPKTAAARKLRAFVEGVEAATAAMLAETDTTARYAAWRRLARETDISNTKYPLSPY